MIGFMNSGLKKHYLYILLLVLSAWFSCFDARLSALQAQTDTIRYVRTSGKFNNDGRSWGKAKNNLQEIIQTTLFPIKEDPQESFWLHCLWKFLWEMVFCHHNFCFPFR